LGRLEAVSFLGEPAGLSRRDKPGGSPSRVSKPLLKGSIVEAWTPSQ
jgi:hypothetical protein